MSLPSSAHFLYTPRVVLSSYSTTYFHFVYDQNVAAIPKLSAETTLIHREKVEQRTCEINCQSEVLFSKQITNSIDAQLLYTAIFEKQYYVSTVVNDRRLCATPL